MTTVAPTYTDLIYTPSGVSNGYQVGNLYIPSGTPPDGGWPVVLYLRGGGFTGTTYLSDLNNTGQSGSTSLPYELLVAGYAVFSCKYTIQDNALPGFGLGRVPWIQEDAWPWVNRDHAAQDVQWAIQYLRHRAAELLLNPTRLAGYFVSAGAAAGMLIALGPDRKDPSASNKQLRQSSRLNALINFQCQTYWPAFIQSGANTWFPLETDTTNLASTILLVGNTRQSQASVVCFGFNDVAMPGIRDLNANLPIYTVGDGTAAISSTTFDEAQEDAFVFSKEFIAAAGPHDQWFAYVLHNQILELAAENPQAPIAASACAIWGGANPLYLGATLYATQVPGGPNPANVAAIAWLDANMTGASFEPVEERILQAIAETVSSVVAGGVYFNDYPTVRRAVTENFAEDPQMPAVSIAHGGTVQESNSARLNDSVTARMRVMLGITVESRGRARMEREIHRAIHDIERALLYEDRTWGGIAVNTVLSGHEVLYQIDEGTPLLQAIVTCEIVYRTEHYDSRVAV